MRKKVFTAAAVCVLSLACVFGATACNNGGGASEPSVQVTEAEWNAAFEKSNALLSASDTSRNVTFSIKGRIAGYDDDGVIYKTTLPPVIIIMVGNEEYEKRSGYDGTQLYSYRLTEGTYDLVSDLIFNGEWYAYQTPVSNRRSLLIGPYSEFTYENGQYITVAYGAYDITTTVKVKINADGYVFYYSCSNKREETGLETDFIEYEFYDFGTTTLNVPAAAKQAVADYKAANN